MTDKPQPIVGEMEDVIFYLEGKEVARLPGARLTGLVYEARVRFPEATEWDAWAIESHPDERAQYETPARFANAMVMLGEIVFDQLAPDDEWRTEDEEPPAKPWLADLREAMRGEA